MTLLLRAPLKFKSWVYSICISLLSLKVKVFVHVTDIGNWAKAHFSPKRFSKSSIGKGLSNARSGLDPF